MGSLEQLVELVPPPPALRELGYRPDWDRVESALGTALPSDFKRLTELYGTGDFCDQVALTAPALSTGSDTTSEDDFARHLRRTVDVLRDFDTWREIGIWPDPGGLLTAVNITTGSELLWVTSGHPDQWQCVEMTRTMDAVQPLGTDLTTTLVRWLSDELTTHHLAPSPYGPRPNGPYFESFTGRSLAELGIPVAARHRKRKKLESAVFEAAGERWTLWSDYEEGSHWNSLGYLPRVDLALRLTGGGTGLGVSSFVLPSGVTEFEALVARLVEVLRADTSDVNIRWSPATA